MQKQEKWYEPFKELGNARYLPLLLFALPQSYVVGLWLYFGKRGAVVDFDPLRLIFSLIGAAAFEFGSVGSIAWSQRGGDVWRSYVVAAASTIFSSLIALYWYGAFDPTGNFGSYLHVGFPLLSVAYTALMHSKGASILEQLKESLGLTEKALTDAEAQIETLEKALQTAQSKAVGGKDLTKRAISRSIAKDGSLTLAALAQDLIDTLGDDKKAANALGISVAKLRGLLN